MLDIKLLRNAPNYVKDRLATRRFIFDVELFNLYDSAYRTAATNLQKNQADHKALSGKIGRLKKTGEDITELLELADQLNYKIDVQKHDENSKKLALDDFVQGIPNIPYIHPYDALIEHVQAELKANQEMALQNTLAWEKIDYLISLPSLTQEEFDLLEEFLELEEETRIGPNSYSYHDFFMEALNAAFPV